MLLNLLRNVSKFFSIHLLRLKSTTRGRLSLDEISSVVREVAAQELFTPIETIALDIPLIQQEHPRYPGRLIEEHDVLMIVMAAEFRFAMDINNDEIEVSSSDEFMDSFKDVSLGRLIDVIYRKSNGR